jgi:cell division protein FtsL
MSRTLVIQNGWFENNAPKAKLSDGKKVFFGKNISRKRVAGKKESELGGAKIKLVSVCFVFLIIIFLSGIVYLYQVNSLATQGFEIKKIENEIKTVEKENKQLQIKEIELRSMNNIEKATEGLNLVNSSNVTYIEVAGPVAMK